MTKSNKIYIGIIAIVALLALVGIGYVGLEYGDKLRDGGIEDVRTAACDNTDRVIIERAYTVLTGNDTTAVRTLIEVVTNTDNYSSDPYCHYILMIAYAGVQDAENSRNSLDRYQELSNDSVDEEISSEFNFLPVDKAGEFVALVESQQSQVIEGNTHLNVKQDTSE